MRPPLSKGFSSRHSRPPLGEFSIRIKGFEYRYSSISLSSQLSFNYPPSFTLFVYALPCHEIHIWAGAWIFQRHVSFCYYHGPPSLVELASIGPWKYAAGQGVSRRLCKFLHTGNAVKYSNMDVVRPLLHQTAWNKYGWRMPPGPD